jgi:hypothetical protein
MRKRPGKRWKLLKQERARRCISVKENAMHTIPTRFIPRSAAAAASALLLALAGCGSSGSSDAPQAGMCASTPPVAPVQGYPVHTPGQGIYADEGSREYQAAACDMIAHYDAGYAIVMAEDADPWTDGDRATRPVIEVAAPLEPNDPQPGDAQETGQDTNSKPVFERYEQGYREVYVMAALPGGQGEPWECDQVMPASEEQAAMDGCLSTLRELDAQQQPRAKQAMADTTTAAGTYGDAVPDREQWTWLGEKSYQFKFDWKHDEWQAPMPLSVKRIGNIDTAFDVYRLNGVDSFDYFLVKAKWSMTPESYPNRKACGPGLSCDFFNGTNHLGFTLQRKHKGVNEAEIGSLVNYIPKNIARNKPFDIDIGGQLKFGSETDGGVTAGISATYFYSAASITAFGLETNSVYATVSNTTSQGDWENNCGICKEPTTIGTMPTTLWALYRFPRTDQDTQAGTEMIVEVKNQWGSMRLYRYQTGLVRFVHALPYKIVDQKAGLRAYAISYALPYFSVKRVDADGKLTDLPRSAANPLKLQRGQVLRLRIETGGTIDSGTPITLGWQVISPPQAFFTIAKTSGAASATIEAVVRNDAPLGKVEYLKFNTQPRAAAPGMDGTDLAIPIQIVE